MPNLISLPTTSTKSSRLVESKSRAIGLTSSVMPLKDKILRTFSLFPEEPVPLLPPPMLEPRELELKPKLRNLRLLKKKKMLIWEVFSTNELYFIVFFY
jgi:hypothetical protein